MAASKKRKQEAAPADDVSSNSENEVSDGEEMSEEEEVIVDFEARCPEDDDFHGIKALLQQLFPKAQINVSELSDLLIEQNYVSSVLKQCSPDDEDDEDMDAGAVVFGVLSVVNMLEKKDKEYIKQLKAHLLDKCQKVCDPEKFSQFEKTLADDSSALGLLLSERFINIPPKIALPLYESLSDDLKTALEKKKPFNFSQYLVISKVVENQDDKSVMYMNAEEELLFEEATFHFDYSVSAERDSGLNGTWDEDDSEGKPKRRVMLLPAAKFGNFLNKLKTEFGEA